jgi:hypothetical protein
LSIVSGKCASGAYHVDSQGNTDKQVYGVHKSGTQYLDLFD